jgi:hypothetical protein
MATRKNNLQRFTPTKTMSALIIGIDIGMAR